MPDMHEVPPTDPSAAPTPGSDPSAAGFGWTTVVDDSRAVLGFPTLPPTERPGTASPTTL
jgi:hypothetical protein